jgi:hypothetical protein
VPTGCVIETLRLPCDPSVVAMPSVTVVRNTICSPPAVASRVNDSGVQSGP